MLNLTTEQQDMIVQTVICFSCVVVGCLIGASIVISGTYKRVKEINSELTEYKNKYGNL